MKRFLLAFFVTLSLPALAWAVTDWGVFPDGGTLYFYTNTVGTDGVAETIGSEAIAVYKDNSDTQLTTGATIDDDVDSTTGFHRIAIDTTQSGFDTGSQYTVMYTAGTVDSVSVAGRIIGSFRLGVVPSNVLQWNTTAIATPDTAGYPKVTIKDGTGTGELNTSGGYVFSDLTKILGTTLAESSAGNLANNLKTFLDNGDNLTAARLDHITNIKTKTDYLPSATAGASGGVFIAGTNAQTTVTSGFGADTITATSIAANAIGASEIATDAIGETEIADSSINAATFVAGAIDSGAMNVTGSEFTSIPWNASWDAEVQSEADDALVANHLDHLLAAAYDPTSKPGNASALLNVLVENDGGVPRFTINALEQGPSGGGGGGGADADDFFSFDYSGATGAATPGTLAYDLLNAPTLEETAEAIGEEINLGAASLTDINQDPISTARTWVLVQTEQEGLIGDAVKSLRRGPATPFAVDFRNDMATNQRIRTVDTVEILSGTADGISFGDYGRDRTLAKFAITADTAGTYTIKVAVTANDGAEFEGVVTLVVP